MHCAAPSARLRPPTRAVPVSEAVAILRASQTDVEARRAALTRELTLITGRERRLLDALVDGDATAGAIRSRLREELARRDALTAELASCTTADALDTESLVQEVTSRAADARALLGRHVAQARQMLRSLLEGRLVCEPFDDGAGRGYTFAAIGTYRRFFREL